MFNRPTYREFELRLLDDPAATNQDEESARIIDEVRRIIDAIWGNKYNFDLADTSAQKQFIEVLNRRYVLPRYADLVGEPVPEHHDGAVRYRLTYRRKYELLLLGVYEWSETCLTKVPHDPWQNPAGWFVHSQPLSTEYFCVLDDAWGVKLSQQHSEGARLLHEWLADLELRAGFRQHPKPPYRVKVLNGNPYDCRPRNLAFVSARGRRMVCASCGLETTKDRSKLVREGKHSVRYCAACLTR